MSPMSEFKRLVQVHLRARHHGRIWKLTAKYEDGTNETKNFNGIEEALRYIKKQKTETDEVAWL